MTRIPARILGEWLPRVRWWPYLSAEDVRVAEEWCEDDVVFLILDYKGENYYLPLIAGNPPGFIPRERVLYINNEVVYEAEFSPRYLPVLDKSDRIEKQYYGSKEFAKFIERVEPLTFETTNIISLHRGLMDVVVKSYRRLSTINPEPLFLDLLTKKKYRYAPKLYARYMWRGNTVSLAMEYIEGIGDGGKPFYEALLEMLEEKSRGLKIGLASLLGTEIAELHRVIGESEDPFFSPEEITGDDVEKWGAMLNNMYKTAVENLEKLVSRKELGYLEYWLGVFDEVSSELIEYAIDYMEKQVGMKKMRIHGDLHLAQFIYSRDRGFILTDFEGEPGRKPGERLLKLPVFRDIASMIRSFQYLAFFALKEHTRLTIDELGRRLTSGTRDPTLVWRNIHLRALTTSYIADMAKSTLLLTGKNLADLIRFFQQYTLPWVIERGFYEVYYETSYGRDLIPIPITGLYEVYMFLARKNKSLSLVGND